MNGSTLPFRRSLAPLLVLALVNAAGFTVMGSFSAVQEGAKAELGLSDYALSAIQGLAVAIPLALCSVPLGILVDRWNRCRLLLILAALMIGGTVLTALSPNGSVLFVARMLTGIGNTGALTASLSLAADLCAPDQRGRAALLLSLGKSAGIAAAFSVTGVLFGLAARHGLVGAPWRTAHLYLAVGVAIVMLPLLLLREPARHEVEAADAPLRTVAREFWARRAFLLPMFAAQISVVMADTAANIWAAPVLTRRFGLSPDQFGGWLGALLLGAGVGGTLLGGVLADVGARSRIRGGILAGMVAAAAGGVPAALFPLSPNPEWFAIGIGALMFCGTITALIMSVALTVYLPNELRGFTIGLFIALAGLIGYGVAPSLVVAISRAMGGETHMGGALAIMGVIVGLISVVSVEVARRNAPQPPSGS